MSTSHPYWVYGPDASGNPSDPEEFVKAVDEGRRAFALELAVKSLEGTTDLISSLEALGRAKDFEGYLKGEDA